MVPEEEGCHGSHIHFVKHKLGFWQGHPVLGPVNAQGLCSPALNWGSRAVVAAGLPSLGGPCPYSQYMVSTYSLCYLVSFILIGLQILHTLHKQPLILK